MDKIVLWGAGEIGKALFEPLMANNMKIECYIDNDSKKWGTEYNGIMIHQPAHLYGLDKSTKIYVTVNNSFERQIISQLSDMGFEYGVNVFSFADEFMMSKYQNVKPFQKSSYVYKKYYAEFSGMPLFVLVDDLNKDNLVKRQYSLMKEAEKLGVPLPRPLEYGTYWTGGGYLVLEYLCGMDLVDAMHTLTKHQQYKHGRSAGEALRRIHSIPLPDNYSELRYCVYRNMNEKVNQFRNKGMLFNDDEAFLLEYIELNKDLINKSETTVVHGDFGLGNMMLVGDELKIVDFNGTYYGDPWWDLHFAVLWIAAKYPSFSVGLLHSYFKGNPSDDDWRFLAFYSAIGAMVLMLNAILNVGVYYSYETMEMRKLMCHKLLEFFDHMQASIPSWYQSFADTK